MSQLFLGHETEIGVETRERSWLKKGQLPPPPNRERKFLKQRLTTLHCVTLEGKDRELFILLTSNLGLCK